jgi:hypothetical protein
MRRAIGRVIPSCRKVTSFVASRGFHASSVVLGRKGASAFVEKPRDFSKKQKKRFKKKRFLHDKMDKHNNSQAGITNDMISQQLESPETKDLIETAGDR